MARRLRWAVAALTLAAATAVAAATAPSAPAPASSPVATSLATTSSGSDSVGLTASLREVTTEYRLPSGRTYLLHADPPPGPERPLVVLLHGLGHDPVTIRQMSGATAFADTHGFTLAYGVGVGSAWNAGTCCATVPGVGIAPVDDVGYLRELVENAATVTPIDRSRVYVWGFSNGGMMAWRAVCQAPDTFAAAGVVGGQLTVGCGESVVAVMHIHGLADTTVRWNGGWSDFLRLSLPDGPSEKTRVGPGSTVEQLTWDGGHEWPWWAFGALWNFSAGRRLPAA